MMTLWIVWGVALAGSLAAAVLCHFVYNMTFFIAALGLLTSFALSAMALRRGKDAKSNLLEQPLWQMAISTLAIQLIAAFLLMAFAGKCAWIVAAVIEGLILCLDAAALTEWREPEEQPAADSAGQDGKE